MHSPTSSSRLRTLLLPLLAVAALAACSNESLSPTEPGPVAVPAASSASRVAEEGPSLPEGAVDLPRGAARLAALGVEGAGVAPRGVPTALASAPAAPVAAVAAAGGPPPGVPAGGKGNDGNGGNNGKGNGGKGQGGELRVDLQPNVWNTEWTNSEGTVGAFIRGADLDLVDLDSIVLVGTDPAAAPLSPLRVRRQGNHIRAFFGKADALATLDTPTRGEIHEVKIELTQDGEPVSLSDDVRIVGPDNGDDDEGEDDEEEVDLRLDMQPDVWNTNWKKSQGLVTAFIRGDGLAEIDLTSIVLVGTDPAAAPLPALRAKRSGNHVRAWFAKRDAIATLDTPKRGENHEITIRLLLADGTEVELTDEIRVVGPNHGG